MISATLAIEHSPRDHSLTNASEKPQPGAYGAPSESTPAHVRRAGTRIRQLTRAPYHAIYVIQGGDVDDLHPGKHRVTPDFRQAAGGSSPTSRLTGVAPARRRRGSRVRAIREAPVAAARRDRRPDAAEAQHRARDRDVPVARRRVPRARVRRPAGCDGAAASRSDHRGIRRHPCGVRGAPRETHRRTTRGRLLDEVWPSVFTQTKQRTSREQPSRDQEAGDRESPVSTTSSAADCPSSRST